MSTYIIKVEEGAFIATDQNLIKSQLLRHPYWFRCYTDKYTAVFASEDIQDDLGTYGIPRQVKMKVREFFPDSDF
jgi:hypothetical protein